MRLQGTVWRAHNPRWSFAPESGDGAALHGGRFNRIGSPALYTSLRFETAWLEAQQGFAFKVQPLTLCAYAVDCADLADLTDPGLGLIKRTILEKAKHILGKPLLEELVISDYSSLEN